ncbi:MAG TPA: TniQ family protein [Nakamurella sp.]|nr:TniQ family protein [Nakamurella sp.]
MNPTTEAIRPLPRQTRPRPGETVESFVHRLARTNHLRPSHLRRLLLNNRNRPYGGSINLTRLAALTGRNAATLGRVFQATEPSHPRANTGREVNWSASPQTE